MMIFSLNIFFQFVNYIVPYSLIIISNKKRYRPLPKTYIFPYPSHNYDDTADIYMSKLICSDICLPLSG